MYDAIAFAGGGNRCYWQGGFYEAVAEKRARRHDGGELPDRIEGAYVSHGGRWVYPDAHGFASLLIEERIELD